MSDEGPDMHCPGCRGGDKVPAKGYFLCPICDAEWHEEEEEAQQPDDLVLRMRQPAVFAEPAESQRRHLVMAEAADRIEADAATITALRQRVAELEEALKPFARAAAAFPDPKRVIVNAPSEDWPNYYLVARDLHRAAKVRNRSNDHAD